MSGVSPCPSCCLNCSHQILPSEAIIPAAYALANFLSAGTIQFSVCPGQSPCNHRHTEDGWHIFECRHLLPQVLNAEDDSLLRELDFLVKHSFISCTCRLNRLGNVMYLRVYLVPFDLANVQGRLRTRDEATILVPARKCLKSLLQQLVTDVALWEGNDEPSSSTPRSFIRQDIDNRTMAEIYGDLPSPIVHSDSKLVCSVLAGDDVGMRSTLYSYQRRSVAAMIEKEIARNDIPSPLYITITGINGRDFYLQPATMEVLQERPMVQHNRGGVLCEELGTGKTVMILALILATLDQLPSPEESFLDTRPVMTPLALRTFPSSEFETARKRAVRRPSKKFPLQGNKVPSLVELLIHHIRISTEPLGTRHYEDRLESMNLLQPVQANTPFYHHYEIEVNEMERSRRKQPHPGPRTVYLTSASLIVVPPNLIAQWDSEIMKHCCSGLRYLVLKSETKMPSTKALVSDYDIVLITHSRFSAEATKCDLAKLHTFRVCQCPSFSRVRVPDCSCDGPPDVSPFLQIRWKRLVIDEGHVMSAPSTHLTTFAQLLSVERRWIVTGTPTTNLLGLSFGRQTEHENPDELTVPRSPIGSSDVGTDGIRRWTVQDREDLRKLATMMTHFLKVPHFAANPKILNNHLFSALLHPNGPLPGAIQVLMQVMCMVMIRHRIDDVEKDVSLPPITQETILLDLDPYAMMSYNALQATIVINAVDSERKDEDYLFHPRNASSLITTMDNLSQIMFWSVADDLYNADEVLANKQDYLERASNLKNGDSDLALVGAALGHVERAASDPLWRGMQTHEDTPYRICNLPLPLVNAWNRVDLHQGNMATDAFMHPDRLIKLRDTILDRPRIPMDKLVEWGTSVDLEDRRYRQLLQHQSTKKNKRDRDHNKSGSITDYVRKATAPETIKEMQHELLVAQKLRNSLAEEANGRVAVDAQPLPSMTVTNDDDSRAALLASSLLAGVQVGRSASSKLNYILDEVLQHYATEKFLIFSKSPLTLAHVAEGLELFRVKHLRFTTQVLAHEREQLVTTFETSETYRVFLMELKHGARGLNLVAASRVIFCEPVWQADVEIQAIKRAHRIGQIRPISVKTLAISSTAEEAMLRRREALKGWNGKLPTMTEEAGMRHFIANPAFLTSSGTGASVDLKFPLIDVPDTSQSVQDSTDTDIIMTPEEPTARPDNGGDEEVGGPPAKKIKTVRWAD